MPALDALTMKRILTEDLDGALMRTMLEGFISSVRGDDVQPVPHLGRTLPSPGVMSNEATGDILAALLRRTLRAAETYYIAPHMLELAEAAGETMPDEPLLAHDAPSSHGFMYLPQPIRSMDVRGMTLAHNAIMWSTYGGEIRLFCFTDKNDPYDMPNASLRQSCGESGWARVPRLTLGTISGMKIGEALPRSTWNTTLLPNAALLDLSYDEKGSIIFSTDVGMDLNLVTKRDPVAATLLAIWRLTQQTLTSVHAMPAPRALRKQIQRANLPDKHVVVIELRKRSSDAHHETEVEWDHRWIVRGHWRNQPCKIDGEWTTRVIYIHPYLKGPEDKPLLIRDRVYALLR